MAQGESIYSFEYFIDKKSMVVSRILYTLSLLS